MGRENAAAFDVLSSPLARVAGLWRYPVKSMLGEECDHLDVNERGVDGDRLFAVRDHDGKLGSGKTTRRFRKTDGLLAFGATYDGNAPLIVFPDGRRLRGSDPSVHVALSEDLGRSVTLAREADVSHLDAGPIHLLTSASLAWLSSFRPEARVDQRRFRPNILVDHPGITPIEQLWLGKTVWIGDDVQLRITSPTERCIMVGLSQADLPEDPRLLRNIVHNGDSHFGVYADVLIPGRIQCGDRLRVHSG